MSKAARIRELYAQGKTCKEIAGIIGCKVEYARICAQQRGTKAVGKSVSKAEAKYLMRKHGASTLAEAQARAREARYADPVLYARHLANNRACAARKRLAERGNQTMA